MRTDGALTHYKRVATGLLPHVITERLVLRAEPRCPGCSAETAEWDVPMGMDLERVVLLEERSLTHSGLHYG